MWTGTGAQAQKDRCGTRQPSLEEIEQIEVQIGRARKVKTDVTIPVWVHVINKGSGFANGDLPEDMIRKQIKVLDDSFSGATGGAGTGFGFELAGVTRTTNETWFSQMALNFEVELQAKTSLKRGGPETLNLYTVDGGPYLGFAYYPNIVTNATYSVLDGVVLDWRSLPAGRLPSTAKATRHRTRSGTGWRCTTRSMASAAPREITSPTRRPSSRRHSSARWDATPVQAPPGRASTRSSTSWTTRRTRACTCSPKVRRRA